MQVSIVAFKKGKLQVLAHAWDRNLGGRDFDEVLFDHFCEEFGAKHKIDIKSNARASFRLRLACEKVRVVSAVPCLLGLCVCAVTLRCCMCADEESLQCQSRSHHQCGMPYERH